MNKNNLLFVLIGGILVFVVLAWFGGQSEPTLQDINFDETQSKELYMSTCNENNKMFGYCDCTWKYLRQTYSINDISQMGLDFLETNNIPDEMYDAALYCSEYLEI